MDFINSINISASGLTAQRLKMDTIASNIANVETTRRSDGRDGPYLRKVVVLEAYNDRKYSGFEKTLQDKLTGLSGVRVKAIKEIEEKEASFRRIYEPGHPDADAEGYVNYPNVKIEEEMINMISSTRAYEANAKVIETTRSLALRALEIGR